MLLTSSLDYKTLQKKSISKLKKIFHCEFIGLYILNRSGSEKSLDNLTDSWSLEGEDKVLMDESTLLGSCLHFNSMIHVTDPSNDLRYHRDPFIQQTEPFQEFLLSPIVRSGETFGVLAAGHKSAVFTQDDQEILTIASSQLATIIENIKLFDRLHEQFIQVCSSLGDAIAKKDSYTGGHTKRVSHFAEMIGRELDLSNRELQEVKLSAALHDIGKIGIEDNILKKKTALNDEEFQVMREHPRLGYEILGHLSKFDDLKNVIDGMRFHHERPDGKGYPYGLKGDEIPLLAQIISVADTFDAMISTRPYRKGLPPMVAYAEILKYSGSQFHPKVVEAFDLAFKKTNMYKSNQLDSKRKAS